GTRCPNASRSTGGRWTWDRLRGCGCRGGVAIRCAAPCCSTRRSASKCGRVSQPGSSPGGDARSYLPAMANPVGPGVGFGGALTGVVIGGLGGPAIFGPLVHDPSLCVTPTAPGGVDVWRGGA